MKGDRLYRNHANLVDALGMTTLHAGQVSLCAPPIMRSRSRLRSRSRRRRLGSRALMGVHEGLLGRRTFSIAQHLAMSAAWPLERLQDLQLVKLRRLLRHAATHCPYYRDILSQKGLSDAQGDVALAGTRGGIGLADTLDIRSLEDLSALPFLSRADLRQHSGRMRWRGMPGKQMVDFTRGTTDDRIAYYWDRRRQAWDKANRLRGHGWHGFFPGNRELHLWPVDLPVTRIAKMKDWLRERRDAFFAEHQLDSLHVLKDRLSLSWQAWRRFNPECVTAYPSTLARLILDGHRVGCGTRSASLRGVFLTGEVTFDWQRRLIEHEFGVPTLQDYGVQEIGALAYSCEAGNWHLAAESAIVEIIRDGRPAQEGEYGELVVTGLESLSMPVLRYCTGDIVRAGSSVCGCGLGLPTLPPVVGRAVDFLEADSGEWVEPARVVASLGEVLDDGSFQVAQAADGSVEVFVVGLPGGVGRPKKVTAIHQRIERLIGPRFACSVQSVSSLRCSMFGKCRYVFSARTLRGLALPGSQAARTHDGRDRFTTRAGQAGGSPEGSPSG